ncbi:MAG: ParB/RepB/Spo0J family partition protein [Mariprofundales bacterium]
MLKRAHKGGGRGLGRGLDALFADDEVAVQSSASVAIAAISPNSYQPRRMFVQRELDALTESIRRNGVLTPVLLRSVGEGFELIAGERRWRAAKAAGLSEIPAVVREVSNEESLTFAIVENEQRDNLSAIESAYAYQRLIDEFGHSQQQVAASVGVSRAQVSNLLRLQQLPQSIQHRISQREMSMGQARPLVGIKEELAEQLAIRCVEQGWSARRMEQEAKKCARPAVVGSPADLDSNDVASDEEALRTEISRHLGLSVGVKCHRDGGGRVTISFAHAGELELLLKRLRREEHGAGE